jgi:phosphonoacetate hydrolase
MTEFSQPIIIAMMDGLDMAYLEQIETPNLNRMAKEGFFKEVSSVFPSVTNVNNVSIACGAWPREHGISANSYFDEATGQPEYMNSANLIRCPTIFAKAKEKSVKSVLLTSKRKTLELFHKDVEIGIAGESPSEKEVETYGQPPNIYSREINYWLWKVAISVLKNRSDIGLIYVHITDYPMHAWGPEQEESKVHLQTLDQLIGEALQAVPTAAFLATADHGMNYKKQCWDLMRVLEERNLPPRFVLSPERDYYIAHHRNFTGCAWIWLNNPNDAPCTKAILENLPGVEEIWTREEAASRFNLLPDHIGDIVVTGDKDTMFGEMKSAHEVLPETYRAHGSLHEMRLPLWIWNYKGNLPPERTFQFNFDLTRRLFN